MILAVEPYDLYAQGLGRHGVEPSKDLPARLGDKHAALHGFRENSPCSFFPLLSLLSFKCVKVPNYFLFKFHRSPYMDEPNVPIQDEALKTYRKRLTIEKDGGRQSGSSSLVMQHDDNDDDCIYIYIYIYIYSQWVGAVEYTDCISAEE